MGDLIQPTVDLREVAYYERLAETWWDSSGPFWPLHRLNRLRNAYIRDQLCAHFDLDPGAKQPLGGLSVLDVGCGGGILSESLARMGASVHGIDVVPRNIEIARLHAAGDALPVRYEVMTAEDLSAAGPTYDAVMNMEVVEHVPDVSRFMDACSGLVREEGMMFVATINRTFRSWLFAIVGAEYVLGWLPRGTHRWRQFPKPEELETMLNQNGLQIIERTGVRVNPISRTFKLTNNLAVNYMLAAVRA